MIGGTHQSYKRVHSFFISLMSFLTSKMFHLMAKFDHVGGVVNGTVSLGIS